MLLKFSFFTLSIFILATLLPFLGLPIFRYGWYTQIEFLLAGFWFVGGLAAIWNIFLFKTRPKLFQFIWSMPVIWSWLPIIILSILVSFFQFSSLQSWAGSPQLGDGILTQMSLLFLSPIFVIISRKEKLKPWLLYISTFVILITSILTILGAIGTPIKTLKFWSWAPILFPNYIAYFVIAIGVIYYHARSKISYVKITDALFVLILVSLTYYSKGYAILFGFALSAFTYGVIKLPIFKMIPPQRKLVYYAGLGFITLTILVCLSSFVGDDLPAFLASIISRAHIGQFTFINYFYGDITASKIFSFLFGNGWGNYNNSAIANLPLIQDFLLYSGGDYKTNLEFVSRDQVNSHNVFLEYFLALGFVGVLSFCYLQYKIILNIRKKYFPVGVVFVVTLGSLLVFWFQLPHTLIFITIAYCILFSKTPSKRINFKKIPLISGVFSIILILCSLTQFISAYQFSTHIAIKQGDDLFEKIDETIKTPWLLYDRLTGANRIRQIMQGYSSDIFVYLEKSPNPKLQEAADKLLAITNHFQKDIQSGSSIASLVLAMNIFAKLSIHPKTKDLLLQGGKYEESWHKMTNLVKKYLPYRSDVFAPYLSYLLVTNQQKKIEEFCSYFLLKRKNDPISYWFLGIVNLQTESGYEKGLCMMKKGLDLGVSKYIPIPESQKNQVQMAANRIECDDYLLK